MGTAQIPAAVKRKQFARLAATGKALVDAHAEARGPGKGTRKTKKETASTLARRPDVRAMIARYEAEFMPIGDYRKLREECESNMRALMHDSPDHKVRLAASKMLHEIANERVQREEKEHRIVNVDSLIQEIGELAAPAAAPVLELTATETADPDEATPDPSEESDDDATDSDDTADDTADD